MRAGVRMRVGVHDVNACVSGLQHPLFKESLVRAVKTKWGTVSLVKAHVALIKQALRNPNNW